MLSYFNPSVLSVTIIKIRPTVIILTWSQKFQVYITGCDSKAKWNTNIDGIHKNFAKYRKSWPKFMLEIFVTIYIFDLITKTT